MILAMVGGAEGVSDLTFTAAALAVWLSPAHVVGFSYGRGPAQRIDLLTGHAIHAGQVGQVLPFALRRPAASCTTETQQRRRTAEPTFVN